MIPTLFWEPTKLCNMRCAYCFSNSGRSLPNECGADDVIEVLRAFRAQGGHSLMITGGEPTLYPDLDVVLNACRLLGISVGLATNGSKAKASWIASNTDVVAEYVISVDGPAEYTNYVRGHSRAFDMVQTFLEECRKADARVTLQFNVSNDSWGYLPWFKQFATSLGIERIRLAHISPWGRAERHGLSLTIDRQLKLLDVVNRWAAETAHRVIPRTNLLTRDALRAFYPSLRSSLAPWLLSDGLIVPFYSRCPSLWAAGDISDPASAFNKLKSDAFDTVWIRAYHIACSRPVVSIEDAVYQAADELMNGETEEVVYGDPR